MYSFGVEYEGVYEVLMNSDDTAFGGAGLGTKTKVTSKKGEMHGFENTLTMDLPGLSFILLKRKPKPVRKPKAKKTAESKEDPATELEKLVAENKAQKAKKRK